MTDNGADCGLPDEGLPDLNDDLPVEKRKDNLNDVAGPSGMSTKTKGKKTEKQNTNKAMSPVIQILSDTPSGSDTETKQDMYNPATPVRKTALQIPSTKRKRCKNTDTDSLMQVLTQVCQQELDDTEKKEMERMDEVAIFCEYVGRQLRDIPGKKQRQMLQNQIQTVIFNAQMGYSMEPKQMTQSKQGPSSSFAAFGNQYPVQTPVSMSDEGHTKDCEVTPSPKKIHVSPGSKKTFHSLQPAKMVNTRSYMRLKHRSLNISSITGEKDAAFEVPYKNL